MDCRIIGRQTKGRLKICLGIGDAVSPSGRPLDDCCCIPCDPLVPPSVVTSVADVRDVVRKILECTKSRSEARFGALEYRPSELSVLSGDPTRAEQVLGWRARVSMEEGLGRTIDWFRSVGTALPEYQPL